MKLYHGTSERHLASIAEHGIRPRGKRKGNWTHTVESNTDCVYLTNAYALRFAWEACRGKEQPAIIEIETDALNPFRILPDEDYLEQATRTSGPAPSDRPMKYRTRWYRKRLEDFAEHWRDSVKRLGTCCYMGTIEPEAVTRVAVVSREASFALFKAGHDPMISLVNYALKGAAYRNYMRWVFDEPTEDDPQAMSKRFSPDAFDNLPPEFKEVVKAHMDGEALPPWAGVRLCALADLAGPPALPRAINRATP